MLPILLLLLPLSQDSAPQDPPPPAAEPYFALQWAGISSLLVDPKDASLRDALQLVDDRLLEVLQEFGAADLPPGTVELLTDLLAGPLALTLTLDDEPIPGMPFPLMGELLVSRASEAEAMALTSNLVTLLEGIGVSLPAPAPGEICALPAPVPVWMGTDGGDFFIRFGREEGLEAPSFNRLAPEGAEVSFSGRLDYGGFLSEIVEYEEFAQGDGEDLLVLFDQLGLTDMVYEWVLASDDEGQHLILNMPGWAKTAAELGLFPEQALTTEFHRSIPADATWAYSFAFDLHKIFEYYQSALDTIAGGEIDLIAMIEEEIGLDVEQDLLAPFGSRGCLYASETTGGGGALSMVLLIELADRDAFLRTLARAKDAVNGPLAELAQGYVRFSEWGRGGLHVGTLTFPGMPVPFEFTVMAGGSHAAIALTPQAAMAAISQVVDPGPSLLDNPAFVAQLPASLEGCNTVQFLDTGRLLRDGYGTMSLLCAALANAVRSPSDPARDAGLILPSYRDLGRDAKAIVGTVRVVGDDLRTEYHADRSQLVNLTGITGMLYNGPALPMVVAGLLGSLVVPQVASSVDDAQWTVVEVDIAMIDEALEHYAANNDGRYPDSLEELIILDANGEAYLDASTLVDPWGDPYGYRPPTPEQPKPEVWCEAWDEF